MTDKVQTALERNVGLRFARTQVLGLFAPHNNNTLLKLYCDIVYGKKPIGCELVETSRRALSPK